MAALNPVQVFKKAEALRKEMTCIIHTPQDAEKLFLRQTYYASKHDTSEF